MNRKTQSACTFLAALAVLPVVVFSQSITLSLDTVVPQTADYSGHAGNANFGPAITGLANFTVTAQSGVSYPLSLSLFCVEVAQNITLPSTGNLFNVIAPEFAANGPVAGHSLNMPSSAGIGVTRATTLEVLYAHVFGGTYDPSALTNSDRQAFQMAVWELSHDDDFNLLAGGGNAFWITTPVDAAITQAQTWVSFVGTNYTTAARMTLLALHSDTIQDFLIPEGPLTAPPIPEPSTTAAILGLLVLAGVIGARARASGPAIAA